MLPQDPSQADPSIIALMHGLKQQESGGDYTATGDKGTAAGAGQWSNQPNGTPEPLSHGEVPSNFKEMASKYGLDSNDFSPSNQNKVMYAVLADDKKQGLSPEQVLSKWNSGDANRYQSASSSGTGPVGAYNVSQYVKNAMGYAQTYAQKGKQTEAFNPTPFSDPTSANPFSIDTSGNAPTTPQTEDTGLGSELMKRGSDASSAVQNTFTGKINPLSGLLQVGGAVAGGINDVAQKGLELIPGVKSIEGLIGKGVSKLASTGTGKKVLGAVNNFTTAHPELSSDIGAVGNIAGAAGLVTGAGAIKDLAGEGIAKVLGRDTASVSEKELAEVASRTVGGRKLLQSQPDALKILSQPEFKPAVESIGGVNKYVTKDSANAIDTAIKDIDENKLQPLLDKNNTAAIADRVPLQTYRDAAVGQAKDALIDEGGINKLFDRIQTKYGDYPTLSQMNEAKRLVAKQITDTAFGSDTYTTSKIVRSSLQQGIEDGATKLGLGDVNAINKEMRALYQADDYLKTIDGKAVKLSTFSKIKKGVISSVKHGVAEGLGAGAAYEGYKKITGQ